VFTEQINNDDDDVMMRADTKLEDIVLHSIALTKLDVLDDLPVVKIGVAYLINGQKIDYYPGMSEHLVCLVSDCRVMVCDLFFKNLKFYIKILLR